MIRRLLVSRWTWLAVAVLVMIGGIVAWLLRPDPFLSAAERALERRDFAEAFTHLEKGLQHRPKDTRLLFLAARTARRARRYEKAEEYLSACQQLEGPTAAIALERALIRAQQGDLGVENYLLKRVEQGDPDTLLIWEVLIEQYLVTFQLLKARDCLDRYLERRPEDVHALLESGFVWENLRFYFAAVSDYRRAVQLEPENDRARMRLGETLLTTGPPEEAAEQFEELRKRDQDSFPIRLGLARAWRQLGRRDEAGKLVDALLAENGRDANALVERGLLALDDNDVVRAEELFRKAVAIAPTNRVALFNLCQCLRLRGKQEELAEYQVRLDWLAADQVRLKQLIDDVLKTPHDPALRYEVGMIYLRSGEDQEGVNWLNMALRESPGYRPAHQALADYYQRTGKTALAEQHNKLAADERR